MVAEPKSEIEGVAGIEGAEGVEGILEGAEASGAFPLSFANAFLAALQTDSSLSCKHFSICLILSGTGTEGKFTSCSIDIILTCEEIELRFCIINSCLFLLSII